MSQNADAMIMLTLSHESRFSHSEWKDIIQRRGLNMNQLKSLVENANLLSWKEEILNWFNTNEIHDDFIIIDDDKSLNDLPKFFKNRLILTGSLVGLNESHLVDIQDIVNTQLNLSLVNNS